MLSYILYFSLDKIIILFQVCTRIRYFQKDICRERIIVPIHRQCPFKNWLQMFKPFPMFERNMCCIFWPGFGVRSTHLLVKIYNKHAFKYLKECSVQTLAFKHRQPKVAEVSLFQVAEVPTNRYDYTLPKRNARRKLESIQYGSPSHRMSVKAFTPTPYLPECFAKEYSTATF